jgi:SAM-dependent methyltransferase
MRYSLGRGVVIKTENAAKPETQASGPLLKYLVSLRTVGSSFDYGCGKLRYARTILRTTDKLTLVDSEAQLGRAQVVFGRETTVRDVARRSNRLIAKNTIEFSAPSEDFDRGFCINVLSVIPSFAARRRVLHLIRQKLRPGGECLFVVQYRNSDFARMRALPNARAWRDGFIIDSLRGFSFYGLISPSRLAALVGTCGFKVLGQHLDDGRVFLMARSLERPSAEIDVVDEMNFKIAERN